MDAIRPSARDDLRPKRSLIRAVPRTTEIEHRKHRRPWTLVLLGLATAAALVTGALLAPPFRLTVVRVLGGNDLLRTEAEVRAKAFLAERAVFAGSERLFLVRRGALAHALLENIPQLATVQIRRRLPSTLELFLQEKVPVAFLDMGGKLLSMDGTGRTIAEATAEEARASGLPLVRQLSTGRSVRAGESVLGPEVILLLHEIIVALPEDLTVSAEELTIPSIGSEEVHVRTTGGWNILLDARRPLRDQLGALEKVVTEEIGTERLSEVEYIDLRVPGKVFYQMKSGRAPETR